MPKNYYIVLGVPASATQADIKAAYRRLAKELHPDHYGKNQTPFQALQEAYAVLSDPARRQSYDSTLIKPGRGDQPLQPEPMRQQSPDFVEPLIPEATPYSINTSSPGNNMYHRRSHFGGMHDPFFDDLGERERAYRRLLALLRVVM